MKLEAVTGVYTTSNGYQCVNSTTCIYFTVWIDYHMHKYPRPQIGLLLLNGNINWLNLFCLADGGAVKWDKTLTKTLYCMQSQSVQKHSWLEKRNMSISGMFQTTHWWSQNASQDLMQHKLKVSSAIWVPVQLCKRALLEGSPKEELPDWRTWDSCGKQKLSNLTQWNTTTARCGWACGCFLDVKKGTNWRY